MSKAEAAREPSVDLTGISGPDDLQGTNAGDALAGKRGDDPLVGLGGNDEFRGGDGDDTCTGSDRFVFFSGGTGDKIITDFGDGADQIVLRTEAFAWPSVADIIAGVVA